MLSRNVPFSEYLLLASLSCSWSRVEILLGLLFSIGFLGFLLGFGPSGLWGPWFPGSQKVVKTITKQYLYDILISNQYILKQMIAAE